MQIEGTDFFVHYEAFPKGVRTHGMLMLNDDNTFSIILDKNASEDQQRKAFLHELDHIKRGDMFGEKCIRSVEAAL